MKSFSVRESSSVPDFLVQVTDLLAIYAGGWIAFELRFASGGELLPMRPLDRLLILAVAAFSALFFSRMHRMWQGGSLAFMMGRVTMGWVSAWTVFVVLLVLTKNAESFSRIWMVTWLGVTTLTLGLGRVGAFLLLARLRRAGYQRKTVLLYGDTMMMDGVRKRLESASWGGYDVVATVRHTDKPDLAELDATLKPNEIWICLCMSDQARLGEVMERLRQSVANIRLLPDVTMYQILNHGMSVTVGIPMVDVSVSRVFGGHLIVKAAQDYLVASMALVLLSPLMLLIAVAIKLTSRGPVLFHQKRHGWNNEEIWVSKFRSMAVHEEEHGAVTQAQRVDPRVTPVGRFLRKTSLDELPQFYNVLQGKMSVVGPRPHAVKHNNQYVHLIPRYALRHKMKPGITGWAQICGHRGETDTLEKMENRVKHDIFYLEHWSLWLDLKIIALTPLATIQNKNVY